MNWHWPQYALAAMFLIEFGCQLAMHGKPRGPFHFGYWFLGNALVAYLLYAGGFWPS